MMEVSFVAYQSFFALLGGRRNEIVGSSRLPGLVLMIDKVEQYFHKGGSHQRKKSTN